MKRCNSRSSLGTDELHLPAAALNIVESDGIAERYSVQSSEFVRS